MEINTIWDLFRLPELDVHLQCKNGRDIKNVCYINTVYQLMLYLLYQPMEAIKDTAFVCFDRNGTCSDIFKKLPNNIQLTPSLYVSEKCKYKHKRLAWYTDELIMLKLRRKLRHLIPEIKTAKLYGNDHDRLNCAAVYNGRDYCLIEDGYGLYSPPKLGVPSSRMSAFLNRILKIDIKTFGRSEHAKEILYTDLADLPLKGKRLIKINTEKAWKEDGERQKLILSVFNLTAEDLKPFRDKKTIIFTQAFPEGHIALALLKEAIDKSDPITTVIKTHPRDTIDYKGLYPDHEVVNKVFPAELLSFVGIKFKTAVTYNSTAVLGLKYPMNRIFLDKSLVVENNTVRKK